MTYGADQQQTPQVLSSLTAHQRPHVLDFVRYLLDTDRERRPSATEALRHRWLAECRYADGLQ